jgi:hypothetical protein
MIAEFEPEDDLPASQNVPDSHSDILDIGLTVLEEVCAFGARYRFRPADPRWK